MASHQDKKRQKITLSVIVSRYYLVVTALIIILVVALGYFFVLKPKYEQISASSGNGTGSISAELEKRQTYLNNLNLLISSFNKINQTEVEKVKKILPSETDIPGLYSQFQTLSEKNNIALASISISEAAPEEGTAINETGGISRLSVNLNLVGSKDSGYNDLKNFLSLLENNLRLFDVNAVYFTPGSPNFTINLITYYTKN